MLINSSSLIDSSSIIPTVLLISDTSSLLSFVIFDINDLTDMIYRTLSLYSSSKIPLHKVYKFLASKLCFMNLFFLSSEPNTKLAPSLINEYLES